MAPYFIRPESALKRSEELVAVGQHGAALQTLHDVVVSKRSRTVPLASMEPIMLKFVELCVNLRKGKTAKEGLHQYKNIAQNTSVGTIELVIKKFIELAEEKVTVAQAKADQIALDAIDDLEASETPESILLSTVSGEQSKDRTDRAVVTPWLKFLWESYRTVLDILRNNARLEILYQTTANQAFQFCLKYSRKTEFRRLCDLLRNHLQNIAKYAHQAHSINLNEPESLQRHLDTRFNQLSAAVELELWQEAFRSVEDIHNLLSMAKRPPKPSMMANYYEKLTKIFMVSENYLFHAAAWNRYYMLVRAQNKTLTDEEHTRMASLVLLSALAIPVITSKSRPGYVEGDEQRVSKASRLSALLGLNTPPTRSSLLKEALSKNILTRVKPELRDLYNILEVQFHPLVISKKANPIMTQLAQDAELGKYVRPLHQVILTRLLQQLSQVYTTIKLDFVLNLATFPEPYNYDAAAIEKFIMNGCKRGELSIRIDHSTQSMTFETDLFAPPKGTVAEGPKLQSSPSDLMRTQLSRLGKCLYTTLSIIDPSELESKKATRKEMFAKAVAGVEEEHKAALARKAIIERKKELIETLLMRKEKEEARDKALRLQQEADAERKRQEEEVKRREKERIAKEYADIQLEEAKKMMERIGSSGGVKVDLDTLKSVDTSRLLEMQVEHIEKEKRELNKRLAQIGKTMDHLERAYRKEEIPLLEEDYERQRKVDLAYHEAARKAQLQAAEAKHAEDIKIKNRLGRIMQDYQTYRQLIESKRHSEFEQRRREAKAKIEEEKAERIAAFRAAKEEAKIKQADAEAARLRAEEEEQRQIEEQRRVEAERRINAERKKAAEEEERRKLDEIAAKQRAAEERAEAKIREREEQAAAAAAAAAAAVAETSSGKYVPPSRRNEGAWRGRETPRDSPREPRDHPRDFPRDSPRDQVLRDQAPRDEPSWRRPSEQEREPERQERWTPRLRDERPSPATEERKAPPRIGGTQSGGWREREAQKEREQGTGTPTPEQQDDEGFTQVKRSNPRGGGSGKW